MNVLDLEYVPVSYAFSTINTSVNVVAGSCLLVVLSLIARLGDAQRIIKPSVPFDSLLCFESNGLVPDLYTFK